MQKDPIKFIQELDLATPNYFIEQLELKNVMEVALQNGTDNQPESYINNKSVISFASEVSGINRQDVLNSTLLAQLAASKKYPDNSQIMDWYTTYRDVLSNIGWNIQSYEFSNFATSKNIFEMENVVLDILGAAIGGSYMSVIVKTLEAFKKLSDSDNKILAFERNTHSLNKGSFQLGIAQNQNNAVALNLGAFVLESSEDIRKILFFKTGKDKFVLKVSMFQGTLNESVFQLVRNDISNKLSQYIPKYIAEIEI